MTNKQRRELEYAIDMAKGTAAEYKVLAVLAPVLLAAAVVVVGVLTGSWWHFLFYVIVLVFYYPKWIRAIKATNGAIEEMRQCLETDEYTLSEYGATVYEQYQASPKALWLGIIMLGIIVVTLTGLGINIIREAFNKMFDGPTLGIGLFLLFLAMFVSGPVIKWCVMLPRSMKVSKMPECDDEQSDE